MNTIAGLDEFGDVADPTLASATQPSVAIKVLDKRNNAIYLWSLDRLQQQLQRMRNLTVFIDRPSYSQHFSSEEPFYNSPPPMYSFIGNALVSLSPVSRRLSSTSTVPIFCRYTAEAIGSCRIDLRILNVTPPKRHPGSGASTRSSSPLPSPALNGSKSLSVGSKINFVLAIDSVKGLSPHDFSAVHLQARLASFIGPTAAAEEVFTSPVIDLESASLSDLKFRRTFTIGGTAKTLAHLREGYAPIEFFASVTPTYLERLERWDELREQRAPFANGNGAHTNGTPSPSSDSPRPSTQPMRRSETEFFMEQTHDVVAWVQLCELGPDGEYVPVPVVTSGGTDPGTYTLHQGLQRRVTVHLACNSGRQLPWSEFTRVRIGNVRLLDPKGRLHDSPSKPLVTLPLLQQQEVEFKPDGTGELRAEALWDSSVHDSILLNRVTGANQKVTVQLTWSVAVETCAEPVQFSTDIAITIQTRDARPPSKLMTFLGSTKVLSKTSTVFHVRLTPPLTRSAKDLWRLDTAEKYVRGEEALGSWRPRGITVVEDYSRLVTMERRAADVRAIRVILASAPPKPPTQANSMVWGGEALLKKSVDLWQKKFGHRGEVSFFPTPLDPLTDGLVCRLCYDRNPRKKSRARHPRRCSIPSPSTL